MLSSGLHSTLLASFAFLPTMFFPRFFHYLRSLVLFPILPTFHLLPSVVVSFGCCFDDDDALFLFVR